MTPASVGARAARSAALIALLLGAVGARAVGAQARDTVGVRPITDSVYVREAGPGRPGRLLRQALARPHVVLRAGADQRIQIPKTADYQTTVIVIGAEAALDGRIRGDLVMVGGDAFVHPGGTVDGRAIAFGGCIYPARPGEPGLKAGMPPAVVRGGLECLEDDTFEAFADGSGRIALDYRSLVDRSVPLFQLPLGIGLRAVASGGAPGIGYDRVNGLSVPFGPQINLDSGRIQLDPTITYRSHLGDLDPAVAVTAGLGRVYSLEAYAARGTFTNDGWIRSDLMNSITTFISGRDTRNYYRADRFDGRLRRVWDGEATTISGFAGAATERAWSVGLDSLEAAAGGSRPWSISGKSSVTNGMRRPNPRVLPGRITSALAGGRVDWESQGLVARLDLLGETSLAAPDSRGFTQLTLDGVVTFPVVRNHTLEFQLHAVGTAADSTPPQRYVYVGGSGTIPTLDLLTMGGDRLLHLDSRYSIPLSRPTVPYLGTPVVMLRHVIGSAGVGRLPAFTQNVGVRVTLGLLRGELMIDPASGDTQTSVGVSLGR